MALDESDDTDGVRLTTEEFENVLAEIRDDAFRKGVEKGRAETRQLLAFGAALNGDGEKFVKALDLLHGNRPTPAPAPEKATAPPPDDDEDRDSGDPPDPDDTDTYTPSDDADIPDVVEGEEVFEKAAEPHNADFAPLELAVAAVEHARRCAEHGEDAHPGLMALYALRHDPDTHEHVASGVVEKAMGWDEAKHPRGRNGRFISRDRIDAAKRDPELAKQLRKEVRPEDSHKLENALSGHTDLGRTKRGEQKYQSHLKREKKIADRDQARAIRDRLFHQYQSGLDLHADDLHELIPHLSTMTHAELSKVRLFLGGAGANFKGARLRQDRIDRLTAWARETALDSRMNEQNFTPEEKESAKKVVGASDESQPSKKETESQTPPPPEPPADPLEGATVHQTERLPLPGPAQNPPSDAGGNAVAAAHAHAERMRQWEQDRPGSRAAEEARDRAEQRVVQAHEQAHADAANTIASRKEYEGGRKPAKESVKETPTPPEKTREQPTKPDTPHPASVPVEFPHVPGEGFISETTRRNMRRQALSEKLARTGALLPDEAVEHGTTEHEGSHVTGGRALVILANRLGMSEAEAKTALNAIAPSGTLKVPSKRKPVPSYHVADLYRAAGKLFENPRNETVVSDKTTINAPESPSAEPAKPTTPADHYPKHHGAVTAEAADSERLKQLQQKWGENRPAGAIHAEARDRAQVEATGQPSKVPESLDTKAVAAELAQALRQKQGTKKQQAWKAVHDKYGPGVSAQVSAAIGQDVYGRITPIGVFRKPALHEGLRDALESHAKPVPAPDKAESPATPATAAPTEHPTPLHQMTIADALMAGKSYAEWSDAVSQEAYDDDGKVKSQEKKARLDAAVPLLGQYVRNKEVAGKHVVTSNGKAGLVTGFTPDLTGAIVQHDDGSTSLHQADGLHSLSGHIKNELAKGKYAHIKPDALNLFAKQIAQDALANNRNISESLRARGFEPSKTMAIRGRIAEEYEKQKQAVAPAISPERQRAMERQQQRQTAEDSAEHPTPLHEVAAQLGMADGSTRSYRIAHNGDSYDVVYDNPKLTQVGNVHEGGFKTRQEAARALAEIYKRLPRHVERVGLHDPDAQAHYEQLKLAEEKAASDAQKQKEAEELRRNTNSQAHAEVTAGLPQSFKRGKVTLANADGSDGETVSGEQVGPFVVHKDSDGTYNVTHQGTGRGVGFNNLGRRDALLAAHLLSQRGDWNLDRVKLQATPDTIAHRRAVIAAMNNNQWAELQSHLDATAPSKPEAEPPVSAFVPTEHPTPLHALASHAHDSDKLTAEANKLRDLANTPLSQGGSLAFHDAMTAALRGEHGPDVKRAVDTALDDWASHGGDIAKRYRRVAEEVAKVTAPKSEPKPKPAPTVGHPDTDRDTLAALAEQAPTPAAKDALEAAHHNMWSAKRDAAPGERRRNTVDRLGAAWRDAHTAGDHDTADHIHGVLQQFGAGKHGPAPGEQAGFDGRYHESDTSVFTGDPVTVERQPIVHKDEKGNEYVAVKGKVKAKTVAP